MFKLLAIISILIFPTSAAKPNIEIWAEPAPNFNITAPFIAPISPMGSGHRGIDFQPGAGTMVTAPTSGLITFAAVMVNRSILTIRSESGLLISFEQLCTDLGAGETVRRGQALGVFCNTHEDFEQHCDECIHLSVRSNFGYLNPELFLGTLRPSELKA